MGHDLHDLLQRSATSRPPALDLDGVLRAGLRRRRRRRTVQGLAVLAVVLLVGAGTVLLPGRAVDLAGPGARPLEWPLHLRAELSVDGPERTEEVGELAGNGWDDWLFVRRASDAEVWTVQRWGPGGRMAQGQLDLAADAGPLTALRQARRITLTEAADPTAPATAGPERPMLFLEPRFAREPAGQPGVRVIAADLPDLRARVARDLGLAAEDLRSASFALRTCWEPPSGPRCGSLRMTSVWSPALGLPLWVQQDEPDDFPAAASWVLRVTHLGNGQPPPSNPAAVPAEHRE
jgi:hypothetical protein